MNSRSRFSISITALLSLLLLSLTVWADTQGDIAVSPTKSRISDHRGDYVGVQFHNTGKFTLNFSAAAENGVDKEARLSKPGGELAPGKSVVIDFYVPKGQSPVVKVSVAPVQSSQPTPPKSTNPPASTSLGKATAGGGTPALSPLSSRDAGKLAGMWVGAGTSDKFRNGSQITLTLKKDGTGTWFLQTNFRKGGGSASTWDVAVSSLGNDSWYFKLTNGTSAPKEFEYIFKMIDGSLQANDRDHLSLSKQ